MLFRLENLQAIMYHFENEEKRRDINLNAGITFCLYSIKTCGKAD